MKFKEFYETMKFTLIKLPFIYLLIILGYILELMVELPWLIKYRLSGKKEKRIR